MKYLSTLLLVLSIAVLSQCTMHKHKKDKTNAKTNTDAKTTAQKGDGEEQFIIPPYVQPEMKPAFYDRMHKGRELYKLYCAGCHGIFTAGKDGVPNFSQKQIDKYSTQYILRDQTNHAVAFKMNPEDLSFVVDYLRYRMSNDPAQNVLPPDPR